MPNTKSAKKAVRSSNKKRLNNLFWKKRYRTAEKSIKKGIASKEAVDVLKEKLVSFQKVVDKSAKEKAIHKNKANRLKSRYAKRISALAEKVKADSAKKTK